MKATPESKMQLATQMIKEYNSLPAGVVNHILNQVMEMQKGGGERLVICFNRYFDEDESAALFSMIRALGFVPALGVDNKNLTHNLIVRKKD